jgi:Zn-dependent peptidase ImmA (M78 family)
MYSPDFRFDNDGVPVVSGPDLDTIGERFVADFAPLSLCSPGEVDIDRFVTRYLGMEQDFQHLSHCGLYLGITVFQSTNAIPVYIPEKDAADYVSAEARTVIIDTILTDERQEHRYRFTMGHEGSHDILHPPFFLNDVNRGIPYLQAADSYIRCRVDGAAPHFLSDSHAKVMQRIEWQANRLSSAILMPKNMVKMVMARMPDRGESNRHRNISRSISEVFNVSEEAAFYRLKDLDYIDKDVEFRRIVTASIRNNNIRY